MSQIDVLYVAFNRLEFTRVSFPQLAANTDWDLVRALIVHDDGSTDGTREYLEDAMQEIPVPVAVLQQPADGERGPVCAMRSYLRDGAFPFSDEPAELLAKVDNDFVMPPGWLGALLAVLEANPHLGMVGTEPGINADVPAEGNAAIFMPVGVYDRADGDRIEYRYRPCAHIGGKGLMRTEIFNRAPLRPGGLNGYFGFTEWQTGHPEVPKGWIDPDLRSFGLDQLPLDHWQALTERYVTAGWMRRWPPYSADAHDLWDWAEGVIHPGRV